MWKLGEDSSNVVYQSELIDLPKVMEYIYYSYGEFVRIDSNLNCGKTEFLIFLRKQTVSA